MSAEPEVALPVEKLVPVQEVALVDDQVRVEVPPEVMLVGEALMVAVGAAGGALTVTVVLLPADPPAPVQVMS
jgi:hypothetical protein